MSAPVLVNISSATFLLTAETGCIIQSADRSVDSKLKEIYDASLGYVMGYVFYDFVATQDWNSILNGTTGLAIAAPGVALSLANTLGVASGQNGVNAGGTYCKTVKISHGSEDLRMLSGSTIQRAAIS